MAENRRPDGLGQENNNYNGNHNYNNNNTPNKRNYASSSLTLPMDHFDSCASTPGTAARAKEKRIDFTALKGAQRTPKTAKASRKSKLSPMQMRPLGAVGNTPSVDRRRFEGGKEDEERERERAVALALEVDTQRMQLISPPPEEVLSFRRHSRIGSVGGTPAAATPRPAQTSTTPATTTKATTTATKRKRSQQLLQEHSTPSTSSGLRYPDGTPMDIDRASSLQPLSPPPFRREQAPEPSEIVPVEATPNPKPRKIRHVRTQSTESPTKARFSRSATRPAYRENVEQEEDTEEERETTPISSQMTSPRKNAGLTTPSRPKRVMVQSPHVKNPDADWLPPVSALTLSSAPSRRAVLGARSRRRSETPIPPYEPPTDVFTPPREVFLSPTTAVSKSAKRKTKPPSTASKTKGRKSTALRLTTTPAPVKLEIPNDIDLLAPMPPPSPSDDPLLLSGPSEPAWESSPLRAHVRRRSSARDIAAMAAAPPETIGEVPEDDEVLPPSSPEPPLDSEDMRVVGAFNWDAPGSMDSTDDSMMHIDPADADVEPVVLFGFGEDEGGDDGGWSDSDTGMEGGANGKGKEKGMGGVGDIVEEGEGEYTGRWRTMLVRTKMDPPSSATRQRQDQWGHPISPYPKIKGKKLTFFGKADEDLQEEEQLLEEEDEEDEKEKEDPREAEAAAEKEIETVEEEVQEETEKEEEEVHEQEHKIEDEYAEEESEEIQEEAEVLRMSVEPEEHFDTSLNEEHEEDEESVAEQLSSNVLPELPPDTESVDEDEDLAEELEVREMSIEIDEEEDYTKLDLSKFTTPAPPVRILSSQESPVANVEVEAEVEAEAEAEGDDDDTSIDDDEPGFVKITSSDPRAAARAAAILKQHDYECYTKLLLKRRHSEAKQRRASFTGVEDISKEFRRRDLAASAISKSTTKDRRKSTLGISIVGETVFIPGTPVTTLPALLQEAEKEVVRDIEHIHAHDTPKSVWSTRAMFEGVAKKDLFKTPIPSRRLSSLSNVYTEPQTTPMMLPIPVFDADGQRVWTKDEWKLLDACFTDQRLDIGATPPGANEDALAPVEMVRMEDVADRFITLMGGLEAVEKWGDAWTRDDLLERARALEKRQRSGHGARPLTPRTVFSFSSPRPSISLSARPSVNIEIPDFTPLLNRRGAAHPRKPSSLLRPIFPAPVLQSTPFSTLSPEKEQSAAKIPKSLLAPRYSHLLEEAIAVSEEGQFGVPFTQKDGEGETSGAAPQDESQNTCEGQNDEEVDDDDAYDSANAINHTPAPCSDGIDVPSPNIGTRVKGFLFSYLPRLSKTSSIPTRSLKPPRPGLPLPPPDVLSKQRGPVTTPARPPIPKAPAPKDLVELHHAPAPLPKSNIPRPAPPKRLVELKGVGMPVEKPVVQREVRDVRPRRSSGSSVKDLVKGFESMSQKGDENSVLKRTKSVNELRKAWKAGQPDTRPKWR
ncbi:hypothetical protein BDN70DRAFT_886372 [Pholiota conissans]|uniref:Uncharacterized protein n=1 Tax=Pholiota conissans TaxID=109636 RepID=A0A9P5YS66_9AGAR|nr:hypothetical protein BDN70DRAFT_886372 [Pholiota conissans]